MGNLGGKPKDGTGGLPKIDGESPCACIGQTGNPFMLIDGGKFPKFGGGSCDILNLNNKSLVLK